MWTRIDDGFTEHLKVVQVGPLAELLHIHALVYAGRNLTDGFISARVINRLVDWSSDGIDAPPTRTLAARLVDAGLWEVVEGGYQIHDYLDYNPSRNHVLGVRQTRAEAGRRGGLVSSFNKQNGEQNESNLPSKTPSKQASKTEAKFNPVPDPDPVPIDPDPVPDPSSSSNAHARAREPGWNAIEQRWRDLTADDMRPLTKAQLTAASAELTRAVERGDEALFWSSMQATAEGGKPWNWFMTRVRGQLNGDVHQPPARAPVSSNGRTPPRTRDPDGRPRDLAGRYRDKIQRA